MHVTRFHLWITTLLLVVLGLFLFPATRIILSILTALHCGIFVWGIFDLRIGLFCPALISRPAGRKRVALTFDDGPDPAITPEVLGLLKRYNAKATFFAIGSKAEKHPELIKQMLSEGHTIGCHDLYHRSTDNFRRTAAMINEIGAAQQIMRHTIGRKPLLYRPPMGLSNPHLRSALRRLNMTCVGWSVRAGEAGNRRIGRLSRIPNLLRDGAIILLHDGLPRPEAKAALLAYLERLLMRAQLAGISCVGVDTLFEIAAYGD